jgi:hypothetical protein
MLGSGVWYPTPIPGDGTGDGAGDPPPIPGYDPKFWGPGQYPKGATPIYSGNSLLRAIPTQHNETPPPGVAPMGHPGYRQEPLPSTGLYGQGLLLHPPMGGTCWGSQVLKLQAQCIPQEEEDMPMLLAKVLPV